MGETTRRIRWILISSSSSRSNCLHVILFARSQIFLFLTTLNLAAGGDGCEALSSTIPRVDIPSNSLYITPHFRSI